MPSAEIATAIIMMGISGILCYGILSKVSINLSEYAFCRNSNSSNHNDGHFWHTKYVMAY